MTGEAEKSPLPPPKARRVDSRDRGRKIKEQRIKRGQDITYNHAGVVHAVDCLCPL